MFFNALFRRPVAQVLFIPRFQVQYPVIVITFNCCIHISIQTNTIYVKEQKTGEISF